MKGFLNILKVFLIVWIWEPLKAVRDDWLVQVGLRPCCDKPDLIFYDYHGMNSSQCLSCGRSRTTGIM